MDQYFLAATVDVQKEQGHDPPHQSVGEEHQLTLRGLYLSRETYVNAPPRDSDARFSADDRGKIYRIFEEYQRMLADRPAEWDMCDAAAHLWLRHVRQCRDLYSDKSAGATRGFSGRPVTCLLCDETQDLLPVQLLLLTIVCKDLQNTAFAADTAQCISAGRSFRFAQLKDLLWRASSLRTQNGRAICDEQDEPGGRGEEVGGAAARSTRSKRKNTAAQRAAPAMISNAKNEELGRGIKAAPPANLPDWSNLSARTLTWNFRTHQGILDFAALIVEVLTHFFR